MPVTSECCASMIVTCSSCSTRFVVSPSALGETGRKVRCARCQHIWFQEPPATPPEPDVIDPSHFGQPEPIPESSALPVPRTRKRAPGILIATALLLMLASVGGAFVVFADLLRPMGLAPAYDAIGWVESDGLELAKLDVQTIPGRSKTRYFIKGTITNTAPAPREIPLLRIVMRDEQGHDIPVTMQYGKGRKALVDKVELPGNGKTLQPGETVPFATQFESGADHASRLHIDLGNSRDLMVRQ